MRTRVIDREIFAIDIEDRNRWFKIYADRTAFFNIAGVTDRTPVLLSIVHAYTFPHSDTSAHPGHGRDGRSARRRLLWPVLRRLISQRPALPCLPGAPPKSGWLGNDEPAIWLEMAAAARDTVSATRSGRNLREPPATDTAATTIPLPSRIGA